MVCFPWLFLRPPSGPLGLSLFALESFQTDLRNKKLEPWSCLEELEQPDQQSLSLGRVALVTKLWPCRTC